MYIETTPESYELLPEELLDGNTSIDYPSEGTLILRYLDGNMNPKRNDAKYTIGYRTESTRLHNRTKLQFNYGPLDSPCLAAMYEADLDCTKVVYLDGNTKLWSMPHYPLEAADGNHYMAEGNLPGETVYPTILTTNNDLIALAAVKDLGYKQIPNRTLYYNGTADATPYPDGTGGMNSLNIFVFDGMIQHYGDKLQVIIHSNLLDKQTIEHPSVNVALSNVNRSHNVNTAALAKPEPIASGAINPNETKIDSNRTLTLCQVINSNTIVYSCYFPNMNRKMYYFPEERVWLDESDLIIVHNSVGTHIYDTSSGVIEPMDTFWLIIVDHGPLTSEYRYRLVYPELMNLPEANTNDLIQLEHNEFSLKGLINIDNTAYWCDLEFYKNSSCPEIGVYKIVSRLPMAREDVSKVSNKELAVMQSFNKRLVDIGRC